MRNAEYKFVPTDTETLLASMIAAYEKITGITVNPASPERLFLSWVASIILQERVLCNYTGNQNIPSRAEGANLDALSELFYATARPAAQPAVCTVRFYISEAQASAVLVPAGTRVTDVSASIYFETVEDAFVSIGDTYVDTQVRCQSAGIIGNGYEVGQLSRIVDLYDYYSACTNITASAGGSDEADDETFYEILRQSMDAYSTAGPSGAYEYHAKAVSTEIGDVTAVRLAAAVEKTLPVYTGSDSKKYFFMGGDTLKTSSLKVYPHGSTTEAVLSTDYTVSYTDGLLTICAVAGGAIASSSSVDIEIDTEDAGHVTIYVLMADGTIAGSTIKNEVLAACSDETVRPLTDHVSMGDPETVPYDINFTYYIPRSGSIASADIAVAVDAAVEEYKAWQCSKLGRDINPSYLISLLMKTGIKRVDISSPVFTQLKDGSSNDVPQIAQFGTATIVNGGVEDE